MVIKKKKKPQVSDLCYFSQNIFFSFFKTVYCILDDASVLLLAKVGTLDGIVLSCPITQEKKMQRDVPSCLWNLTIISMS